MTADPITPSSKLPPPSVSASDAVLAEHLRRNPDLMRAAHATAATAYEAARALPVPRLRPAIERAWLPLAASIRNARGADCLRLLIAAGDAMRAIATLPPNKAAALADDNWGGARPADPAARRAAMSSVPALAFVLAREDAEIARITAMQQQQAADAEAAFQAGRPAAWLAVVRAAGVEPRLDDGSALTVAAGDLPKLTAQQRAEAAAVRPGIVAALQAEAEAAAEASRRVAL